MAKAEDYYNKINPYSKNGLPPVVLKTAQCFYKGKSSMKNNGSDDYIKIEKPKQPGRSIEKNKNKNKNSTNHLLDKTTGHTEAKENVSKFYA